MAPTPRTLFVDAGNVTYACNCLGSCIEDPYCIPSSPPPPLTPVTTQFSVNPKSHLVTNLLIATAAVLASCFLLIIATYAIHRLRRRRRLLSVSPADPPPNAAEGGTEVDHHIWNIRTVGLEESVIHSIATSVYSAKSGGTADCSVCLGEFHDGEILRLLPKCGHAFHLPCIDRWLRSHLNCPLCRAPVLTPDNPSAAGELGSALPAQTETTQVGGLELEVVIHPTVAASSSSHSQPTDLPTDELQPVRRSVSMDSASLAVLMLRASPGDEMNEVAKNKGRQVNGVKEQKGEKGMVRSSSTRSGRFFLSRHRRWNSVLPV